MKSEIWWSIVMAWKMRRPSFVIDYTIAIYKDWRRNKNGI